MRAPHSNVSADVAGALNRAIALLATDPLSAEAIAREILALQPTHADAGAVLGAALHSRGQLDEARDVLGPLADTAPDAWRARFELARVLHSSGLSREAMPHLTRALDANPGLTEGWRLLGDQLMLTGDVNGAQLAYARLIQSMIRDPRLQAPAAALAEGRLQDAETSLRVLLNTDKAPPVAVHLLAEVIGRAGRWSEAKFLLSLCLKKFPDFDLARQSYAIALMHLGLWTEAIDQADQLLLRDPANKRCRMLKAAAADQLGDSATFLKCWESLRNDFPDQPRAWLMVGRGLHAVGRSKAAIDAYKQAIALEPGFGEAYWSIGDFKTYRFTAEETVAMRSQLEISDLSLEDRIYFNFAIGKALEDAGDYKSSFEHYAEGARLKRSRISFDPTETARHVARCRTVFTPELFAARTGSGLDTPAPIFILGLPRSGSTLVEQILSSHSAVEGTMELQEIISIARSLAVKTKDTGDISYIEALADLDGDALTALGHKFIERTKPHRKLGRQFFIDKMPNNFLHIGLIQLILPKAKIIDVRRHPLGAGFSIFKQNFGMGQSYSFDLAEIGRHYRDYVDLMAHFDAVLPGRVHRVFYEDLVNNPERTIQELLEYCDLPFEEGCLKFYENDRAVKTPSSEQVRKPIFREGVDQWRYFDPWLGPLQRELGSVLKAYPAVPEPLGKT